MSRRAFLLISLSAAAVFAAYASLFLCFFVDDEAIPLVYARNLLRGRGFVYTVLEGRVEGYSDFLHVLWSALLLVIARMLGLSVLAPIAIGKAVSIAAGVGVLWLSVRIMRDAGANAPGLTAGAAFLALSGPLALWSCSSLETTMFALLVTALAFVLVSDRPRDTSEHSSGEALPMRVALMLGAAILLERIDGFIYVATLLAAAMLWSGTRRRRRLLMLTAGLALVFAAYSAWRYAYFGSLISAPVAAKVLYRFTADANQSVNAPEQSYLRSFVALYGILAAPVFMAAVALAWRHPLARQAVISLIVLGAYVGLVGDWMFGWRFTVALLPLTAVVIGLAVTRAPKRLAWGAAIVVIVWSSIASRAFVATYVGAHRWPIFWERSRTRTSPWLQPYADLLVASRDLIHAGDRIAYNQAGILPYAFDLENIDDLGICSRFVARLPTTDVTFTAVGRYSPLRNQPVISTAQAYLLYQDVRFLVSRTHLLRGANRGAIPDVLLDGYFRRIAVDANGENAIYERTPKDASAYQRDPDLFTENLAHVSRLVRGSIGKDAVVGLDLFTRFAFAREEKTTLVFDTVTEMNLQFASQDEDVFALYIESIAASAQSMMTVLLFNDQGIEVARRQIDLPGNPQSVLERFQPHVRARSMTVRLRSQPGEHRVTIRDMKLAGQSAALRDYVRQNLTFR